MRSGHSSRRRVDASTSDAAEWPSAGGPRSSTETILSDPAGQAAWPHTQPVTGSRGSPVSVSRLAPFLLLQAAAAMFLVGPAVVYRSQMVNRRAAGSVRLFLWIAVPISVISIEVLAFSVLLGST